MTVVKDADESHSTKSIPIERQWKHHQFGYKMLLKFIFDRYGLSEHMMTSRVEVALTLDGARISKTIGHVTARIKLVDSWCMDPLSGKCLFTLC